VRFATQRGIESETQRLLPIRHTRRKAQGGDAHHSFGASTAVRDQKPVIGGDILNAISRKPLTIEYFRRSKKNGHRSRAIEYTLIAFLITFAALQAFFAVGLRTI
jgi:hypothetical protein